jgi:hypothetical protein
MDNTIPRKFHREKLRQPIHPPTNMPFHWKIPFHSISQLGFTLLEKPRSPLVAHVSTTLKCSNEVLYCIQCIWIQAIILGLEEFSNKTNKELLKLGSH